MRGKLKKQVLEFCRDNDVFADPETAFDSSMLACSMFCEEYDYDIDEHVLFVPRAKRNSDGSYTKTDENYCILLFGDTFVDFTAKYFSERLSFPLTWEKFW